MSKKQYLEIDGAFGEGGGSILRIAAGFSVLFDQPIKIFNIRANRPQKGLRLQHLLGLQTLASLTGSQLNAKNGECKIGTEEITFNPNLRIKDHLNVNVNTAASIGLLIQPIQISSLRFSHNDQIMISIKGGGTFGKWAPSLNYLMNVTYPIFKISGLEIEIKIEEFGFYPKGGALTKCKILPPKMNLKPLNLTELGNIELIEGEIIFSNLIKEDIGERIKRSIRQEIKRNAHFEMDISCSRVKSVSPGVGVCLWAHSDSGAIISSGTILGERNISSEKLGKMATREILKYIFNQIPVDNYLSDQLIPLIAFIKESSSLKVLEITGHTKTNLELVKLFTNRDYEITQGKNSCIIEYF